MSDYEWDTAKEAENKRKHGLDLSAVKRFEWDLATIEVDDRENYGELREKAVSFIGDVPHVLIFTRRGEDISVISLRTATKQERRRYVEERQ